MKVAFEMTDILEFIQTPHGILIYQKKYECEVLKKFNMMNCNSKSIPVMVN